MEYETVISEEVAGFRSESQIASELNEYKNGIAEPEIAPIDSVPKPVRHRPSSGQGEALYPPASQSWIKIKEAAIKNGKDEITRGIAEIRDLKERFAKGEITIVTFDQKRGDIQEQIRARAQKQQWDRYELRPAKPSFRNGPEEKRKRKERVADKAKATSEKEENVESTPQTNEFVIYTDKTVHKKSGSTHAERKIKRRKQKKEIYTVLGHQIGEIRDERHALNQKFAAGSIDDQTFRQQKVNLNEKENTLILERQAMRGQQKKRKKKKSTQI